MVTRILTILFLIFVTSLSFGQNPSITPTEDPDSSIFIETVVPTDSVIFQVKDSQEVQRLYGNVVLENDSIYFKSDSAIITNGVDLEAGGNIVVNRGDTLFAYCDRMNYSGINQLAHFFSDEVIITSPSINLLALDEMDLDFITDEASYSSGGQMYNDSLVLLSRRGTYYLSEDRAILRDSVVCEFDSMRLYSDSLLFDRREMKVYFIAPTRMENDSDILYCEDGHYDLNKDIGVFKKNVEFVQDKSYGTSDSIIYYGGTELINLMGNAEVVDSTDAQISADLIEYDRKAETLRLKGKGLVVTKDGKISSDALVYNLNTEKYYSEAKVFVANEDYILEADRLESLEDDQTLVSGDVKWQDLKEGSVLYTSEAILSEESKTFVAYGDRPVFVMISENEDSVDSTFIMADTLRRDRIEPVEDSISLVKGFYDVLIWNSSFSAVCDSLAVHESDSVIFLYKQPIIWNDSSQIWGDTVSLFLKNKNINEATVKQNAKGLVLTKRAEYQNQLSGREMFIDFEENEIQDILLVGNAQSIYFVEDEEEAYVGANEIKSGRMLILFEEKDLSKIKFFSEVDGIFHDIDGLQMSEIGLEGIESFFSRKPERSQFPK